MAASARKIDENGFLEVKGCPISSFGIFDYSAGQLGMDGDPNRIVKVYRPESAVNDPEAMDSFKNVPFIVDHEMLSGFTEDEENEGVSAPEDKGIDGILTSNVYYAAPWMRGDLKIFSRKAQQALKKNKKDLSLGYSCDFELSPGVFDGQPYEAIQTNIRGNHIALVDEGRIPGARVLDGLCFDHLNFEVKPSDEGQQMSNSKRKTAKDNAVQQLQALIPALQKFLGQEAKEPEHQGEGGEAVNEAGAAPNADETQGTEGAEAGAAENGEAGAGEGGNEDVTQLIAQVKAALAQLEASLGAGVNAGEAGDDGEGNEGQGEGGEMAGDNAEAGKPPIGKDGKAEDDEGKGEGGAEEGNGKASAGPKAGSNAMAGDSAIRRFYADSAAKDRIYNRVSALVGAFDHKSMDSHQVALYGLKKLGLKAAAGQEKSTLDAYLNGVDAANKKNRAALQGQRRATGDSSSFGKSEEMDAYLAGSK